jgi:hypothetical protein
VDQ